MEQPVYASRKRRLPRLTATRLCRSKPGDLPSRTVRHHAPRDRDRPGESRFDRVWAEPLVQFRSRDRTPQSHRPTLDPTPDYSTRARSRGWAAWPDRDNHSVADLPSRKDWPSACIHRASAMHPAILQPVPQVNNGMQRFIERTQLRLTIHFEHVIALDQGIGPVDVVPWSTLHMILAVDVVRRQPLNHVKQFRELLRREEVVTTSIPDTRLFINWDSEWFKYCPLSRATIKD